MVCLSKLALFSGLIASLHGVAVDEHEESLLQPIGIDFSPEVMSVPPHPSSRTTQNAFVATNCIIERWHTPTRLIMLAYWR